MSTPTNLVTRWKHSGYPQHLILGGSIEKTRKEAEAHFGETNITGTEEQMTTAELEALPEWEG